MVRVSVVAAATAAAAVALVLPGGEAVRLEAGADSRALLNDKAKWDFDWKEHWKNKFTHKPSAAPTPTPGSCRCRAICMARGDPHLRRFDGENLDLESETEEWHDLYAVNDFSVKIHVDAQKGGKYITAFQFGDDDPVSLDSCSARGTEDRFTARLPVPEEFSPVTDMKVDFMVRCNYPKKKQCRGQGCELHWDVVLLKQITVALDGGGTFGIKDLNSAAKSIDVETILANNLAATGECMPPGPWRVRNTEWKCKCNGKPPTTFECPEGSKKKFWVDKARGPDDCLCKHKSFHDYCYNWFDDDVDCDEDMGQTSDSLWDKIKDVFE